VPAVPTRLEDLEDDEDDEELLDEDETLEGANAVPTV
jgi:hypothetical protein